MEEKPYLISIKEILNDSAKEDITKYEIACFESSITHSPTSTYISPAYTDAYIYILIKSGNGKITINYKSYVISKGCIIILTPVHIVQLSILSVHFSCQVLFVNKSFTHVVPSIEKIFKHLNRSLKLFSNPIVNLYDTDFTILLNCLIMIETRIKQTDHLMQKEIIQNTFITFLLEWINCYEHYTWENPSKVDLNRSEQILKSFITLLKKYFKKEHHVSFYAEKLHITPQYLTLIIKRLTGQTVNEFIYEMLYSEARILLTRSHLSIQQIADELHFSDSSAFCKFFKRKSGIAPLKLRKN